MDFYGVTNTGSLWVFNFRPHRFQSVQLNYFYSKTIALCGIGKIIGCGGMTDREYLGSFLLAVEHVTTDSGYRWCQIYTDPTQNDHCMSVFTFLYYFLK